MEIPEFTVCPDDRCGLPAEIVDVYTLPSTDGPAEHVVTMCIARHKYHQLGGIAPAVD